ncbi:MAG TPA: efflux RND transporter periplasmic adaptor subunit [Casimicrobiaceae bacterium]|nr:efflux RND transporter periplasmic adaptor subunit [Casimicrobiaceae bacterium]
MRLAALAALVLAFAVPARAEPGLDTLRVAAGDYAQGVEVEASIEAVRQATLASQVAGRVVELTVKAGDTVRAGQVLARIDARSADAALAASRSQVAEAEANLANAKRVHERNQALVAQKFVSQAAADQSASAYQAALAQRDALVASVGSASAARDWTTIAAPFAGVVGETHVEVGDMATPGRALVTVFDPREMRAVAIVPQAMLAHAKVEGALVEVPALATTITPLRASVIPVADARTHTTRVRFDLPPTAALAPGHYARVRLATAAASLVAIPESALVRRGEVTAVYVVDATGAVRLRQVRTGERVGSGAIEILAGLSAGETIAANPVAAGMRTAAR